MAEVKRIVEESEVVKEDDKNWPEPNRDGRQEFEVVMGNQHISFAVRGVHTRHHAAHHRLSLSHLDLVGACAADCQDRLVAGRSGEHRPRGSTHLLLPRAGSQVPRLLAQCARCRPCQTSRARLDAHLTIASLAATCSRPPLPHQAHLSAEHLDVRNADWTDTCYRMLLGCARAGSMRLGLYTE